MAALTAKISSNGAIFKSEKLASAAAAAGGIGQRGGSLVAARKATKAKASGM
jgi:hypothetical protein